MTFQGQLDSREARILKHKEELRHLQIMNEGAQIYKESAKVTCSKPDCLTLFSISTRLVFHHCPCPPRPPRLSCRSRKNCCKKSAKTETEFCRSTGRMWRNARLSVKESKEG